MVTSGIQLVGALIVRVHARGAPGDRGRTDRGLGIGARGVLVTSISLVSLFSVSGIAMSAMVLACTARFMDETRHDRASAVRRLDRGLHD